MNWRQAKRYLSPKPRFAQFGIERLFTTGDPSHQIRYCPDVYSTMDSRAALIFQSKGTIISATMLMILISGFTAGPAVSL